MKIKHIHKISAWDTNMEPVDNWLESANVHHVNFPSDNCKLTNISDMMGTERELRVEWIDGNHTVNNYHTYLSNLFYHRLVIDNKIFLISPKTYFEDIFNLKKYLNDGIPYSKCKLGGMEYYFVNRSLKFKSYTYLDALQVDGNISVVNQQWRDNQDFVKCNPIERIISIAGPDNDGDYKVYYEYGDYTIDFQYIIHSSYTKIEFNDRVFYITPDNISIVIKELCNYISMVDASEAIPEICNMEDLIF